MMMGIGTMGYEEDDDDGDADDQGYDDDHDGEFLYTEKEIFEFRRSQASGPPTAQGEPATPKQTHIVDDCGSIAMHGYNEEFHFYCTIQFLFFFV